MRGRAETLIEPRGPHASREMLRFFLEHVTSVWNSAFGVFVRHSQKTFVQMAPSARTLIILRTPVIGRRINIHWLSDGRPARFLGASRCVWRFSTTSIMPMRERLVSAGTVSGPRCRSLQSHSENRPRSPTSMPSSRTGSGRGSHAHFLSSSRICASSRRPAITFTTLTLRQPRSGASSLPRRRGVAARVPPSLRLG